MRQLQKIKEQNLELINEFHELLETYVSSGNYVAGALTEKFESDLAQYSGCKFAVAVNSGTFALEISLKAAGVCPGDFVGIPALTFVATAFAVINCGGIPVLIDIDSTTWNISLETTSKAFKFKAFKYLVPVHLHGQHLDLSSFGDFIEKNEITVIEDSAQSINRNFMMKKPANISLAAATSFYPGKNLGSITEGGAILTNSEQVANFAKLYRNWGALERYKHDSPGGNYRISEFGAGILSIKLKKLDHYITVRKSNARLYIEKLQNIETIKLPYNVDETHTFHIFSILSENRDQIKTELEKVNYQTGMHYPRTINQNAAYKNLVIFDDISNAEKFAQTCLSLPMDEYLKDIEVVEISNLIRKICGEK